MFEAEQDGDVARPLASVDNVALVAQPQREN
jgi:hypothetical protein